MALLEVTNLKKVYTTRFGGNGADRETENENIQPRQALHGAYRGLSVEWKSRAGCGGLSFFTLHYNLFPSKNPGNAVGSVKSET